MVERLVYRCSVCGYTVWSDDGIVCHALEHVNPATDASRCSAPLTPYRATELRGSNPMQRVRLSRASRQSSVPTASFYGDAA